MILESSVNEMLAERQRDMPGAEMRYQPPAVAGSTSISVDTGVISAQRVAVQRNDTNIFLKIKAAAAAAGMEWFYSWETKNKDNTKTEISGPTIKCANAVARLYGNCAVDCRAVDDGTHTLFLARFVDIETGYQLTRPFRQRKSQATFGDVERQQDIAFQIGASKAIRNVICNALETYADYAYQEARNCIVERIGKNLDQYRQRVIGRLAEMNIALVRIEKIKGKVAATWVAKDIAQIIAEIQSVSEGMAMADDIWPRADDTEDPKPQRQAKERGKKADAKPDQAPAADDTQQTDAPQQEGLTQGTQPATFDAELLDMDGVVTAYADPNKFAEAFLTMLEGAPALAVVWEGNPHVLATLTDAGRGDLAKEISVTNQKLQQAREKAAAPKRDPRPHEEFFGRRTYAVRVGKNAQGGEDMAGWGEIVTSLYGEAVSADEIAKMHADNMDTVKRLGSFPSVGKRYEEAKKAADARVAK